jgi:GNAT superfamily N-acetyltransferase
MIREAVASDIAQIVRVHGMAFPDSFLTRLGPQFLKGYYRLVLEYEGGILLVDEADSRVLGFAAGFRKPALFYSRTRQQRGVLVIAVLIGMLRRPWLAPRVLTGYLRVRASGNPDIDPTWCELSSLAVDPGQSTRGIGSDLVAAFLRRAWEAGASRVCLTTDATGNEGVNRFYRKRGFVQTDQLRRTGGRLMNLYTLERPSQPLAERTGAIT